MTAAFSLPWRNLENQNLCSQVPGQRERQEDDQQQHQVRHGQGGEGRVRPAAGGPDQAEEGDGGEGEGSEQRDRQTVGNKSVRNRKQSAIT